MLIKQKSSRKIGNPHRSPSGCERSYGTFSPALSTHIQSVAMSSCFHTPEHSHNSKSGSQMMEHEGFGETRVTDLPIGKLSSDFKGCSSRSTSSIMRIVSDRHNSTICESDTAAPFAGSEVTMSSIYFRYMLLITSAAYK